jgi:hypothetical protein
MIRTRRWGLIVIGAALLIGGLIWGASSHPVAYQSVSQGTVAHFLAGDSTGYLKMDGSERLYIINENDFTPTINGTDTFANGDTISFVYRTDGTTNIDETSTIGTHLSGPAYTIVELTVYVNGRQKVYNTSDYSQHPSGSYQNNWLGGGTLAFIGFIIAGLAFVLPLILKNKVQPAYSPAAMGMQGQGQPNLYQQQAYQQPYQQPYQNPGQYNQYDQYGQYNQNNAYPPQPPQQPGQYPPTSYNQPYGQAQPGQYEPTQRVDPYNQPPM